MILESLRQRLLQLGQGREDDAEMVTFVSEGFETLINNSQEYLKLFNNLLLNSAGYLKTNPDYDIADVITKINTQNATEHTQKLDSITKKVVLGKKVV